MSDGRPTYLLFGGSGYIGCHLASRLRRRHPDAHIILADLVPPLPWLPSSVAEWQQCDVREPIHGPLVGVRPHWTINLAAVHREPGHLDEEYFATNTPGARNVCEFASIVGCKNLLFTSSIAVYGPRDIPCTENVSLRPTTAYGRSKLDAERIHATWQASDDRRKLVVARPGVVYGPHDPGNILRMINAIRGGYFVLPGPRRLRKSYAYIEGLLDSIEWSMARPEPAVVYNYVDHPTEQIGAIVEYARRFVGRRLPVPAVPLPLLLLIANVGRWTLGDLVGPLHPTRVRKAATQTWIVPELLESKGFEFRYTFASALEDWRARTPDDFARK